jgi:hypothetical protein
MKVIDAIKDGNSQTAMNCHLSGQAGQLRQTFSRFNLAGFNIQQT